MTGLAGASSEALDSLFRGALSIRGGDPVRVRRPGGPRAHLGVVGT